MLRRALHLLVTLTLLVQGLTLAWAQPQHSPHSSAPSAAAEAELPPCHGGPTKEIAAKTSP